MIDIAQEGFDLVSEVVRVFKVRRLYDRDHPQRIETEGLATDRIDEILESIGPIEFEIGEDRLLWGEEVVYEQAPGTDSVAFLLYREGLRRISFHPGLGADELSTFLDHVADSTHPGAESDLLARLWEERLVNIRYVYVESLADQEWIPRLREGEEVPARSADARLIDLDQADRIEIEDIPLIVESETNQYRLDVDDMEYLNRMLEREQTEGMFSPTLTCIRELLLDPPHADPTPILVAVTKLHDAALRRGEFHLVEEIHECLAPYRDRATDEAAVASAFREMRSQSVARPILSSLARRMASGEIADTDMAEYVEKFGGHNLPALLAGVPDIKRLCQQPALAEAFTRIALDDIPALIDAIGATEGSAAASAAYLGGLVADPKLVDVLGAGLRRPEVEVRRECLLALKHFDGAQAARFIADLVDDPEPSIRLYALRHVIAQRYGAVFERTVAPTVEKGRLAKRSLTEKRLWYEAYGVLGGGRIVDRMRRELLKRGGWFRRVDKSRRVCAAIALAAGGTGAGQRALDEALRSSNAHIREAAHEARANFPLPVEGA